MADRPVPDADEIEVTPEMVEAGVESYCAEFRGQVEEPDGEEVVISVYRAMRRVARRDPRLL